MVAGKIKKCKVCHQEYRQFRSMDKVCSLDCAVALAKQQTQAEADKAVRRDTQRRREKIKTKSDWAREAQKEFNAYIRLRDHGKPCISCGRHHEGQYHAGHYRTVGAHPELRFNEDNCHKQCAPCNNHKSGNIVEYRINLAERIGDKALEVLEGHHEPAKYTIDDLKDIKAHYRAAYRALKREMA